MEYAIGKIEIQYNGTIRIIVLSCLKKQQWISENLRDQFPPDGKVFAPNLQNDNSFLKDKDIIGFTYIANPLNSGRDEFILPSNRDGGTVWKCPQILRISLQDIYNHVQLPLKNENYYFFLKKGEQRYICGPITNNLHPKKGKEVNAWQIQESDYFIDGDYAYLAINENDLEKRTPDFQVDCMSTKQLSDWLKEKLNLKSLQIDHSVLNTILTDITEISKQNESFSLDQQRLHRISENFAQLKLLKEDLLKLCKFNEVETVINDRIKEQYQLFELEHQTEIDARKKQYAKEIDKITAENQEAINCLKAELAQKKNDLNTDFEQNQANINFQIQEQKSKLNNLKKEYETLKNSKDEIIQLIKLESEICPTSINSKKGPDFSYPLEHIAHLDGAQKVSNLSKEIFCDRINESLHQPQGFMRNALSRINRYNILKTNDIRTGIYLASVLGNSIYELCQPSPRWIEFKDFWNESLKNIWESAHLHPDIWHFLLIENFNIALPECWGMPLWNMLEGKIQRLPLAENPFFPPNLRIIISAAAAESDDNSHLGLKTRIADTWSSLNVDANADWNTNGNWQAFVTDKNDGLAINEEYFYPVN